MVSLRAEADADRYAYIALTRVVDACRTYRLLLLALVLPFVGAAGPGQASEFHVNIVAVDLSGRQVNLTPGASFNAAPAVARDGRIAFVSDRDGVSNVYVMDAGGGNVRRLSDAYVVGDTDVLEVSQVAWSPRGDRIAFDSFYALPNEPNCTQYCVNWDVVVIGSDGSGLGQFALAAREAAWSPDGRRLAFVNGVSEYDESGGGVTIKRLDGSGSVDVGGFGFNPDAIIANSGPVWSPSGDALAFEQTRGEQTHPLWVYVYIVGTNDRVGRAVAVGHDPSWSPNGKHLAFIDGCKLMTINRNGTGKRRLSPPGECVQAAAWSPKAPLIAYLTTTTPGKVPGLARLLAVETVSADGRRHRDLARPLPAGIDIIWSGPVWTHDGKRILVALG